MKEVKNPDSGLELTTDQIDLIKRTVAKNATDDELKLFLHRAKNLGLDPLRPGEIHFVKYGSGSGSIIIGIEGFRAIAASTGLHTGTKRGLMHDDKGKLTGAWAEVYRKDWEHPARDEVLLREYSTGRNMWQKMPATMIKKVAEVAALRMAFSRNLAGLYSHEEMDQATQQPSIDPMGDSEKPQFTKSEKQVTQAQLKRLFAIMKSKDLTTDDVKKMSMNMFGKESSRDLTMTEYDELCSAIESRQAKVPEPVPDLDSIPNEVEQLDFDQSELPWPPE